MNEQNLRAAIRGDLEKIEAYHLREMEAARSAGNMATADVQQRLAGAVRASLVAAQVAVSRVMAAPA